MKRHLSMLVVLFIAMALVVTGCQPAAPAGGGEPVAAGPGEAEPSGSEGEALKAKIGIVVPLSGDVKTFGESTRDAALMAFEEAEGIEIEYVIADSKCDAQEAFNAANKVISEDGVSFIIGEVCSSASLPISDLAEEFQVLQISPTSTSPAITVNEDGSTKEYVFRACFLDPFQGEVMAALANEMGATKAAVLYDVGNDYVKGLAEYSRDSFIEMGGEVAVYEAYTKADTDSSGLLGNMAAAARDVIFLPDYYPKVNLIAAQIQERGIEALLVGGDGWDSPELQLDLLDGGYFSNHYSPYEERDVVQNFVNTYREKYGATPDALAALAYDATRILIQSIKDANSTDPSVVKDAMAAISYEGISGVITYDEQHNPVKKAAVMKVEDGQVVFYKFVAP